MKLVIDLDDLSEEEKTTLLDFLSIHRIISQVVK